MNGPQKITLQDIASRTGVSRMAVSLTLRGKPGVSDATRRKVLEAARNLGYRPDPEVSNLMSRIRARSPAATKATLALLTPGPVTEGSKRSVTECKYVEGILARALEYGYRVEEFTVDGAGCGARMSRIIWSRGIEGIILRPLQHGLTGYSPRSMDFGFDRFCTVAISETMTVPELDRVLPDQYSAMLKVLAELSALGYKVLGLVIEEELNLRVNGKWTAAFLQHPYRSGALRMAPPLILPSARQAGFDRWFDRHRPDVIISVSRFALPFLEKRGLSIPGDIGYVSLDLDGDLPDYAGLSGIDQNSRLVGAGAVDRLAAALQRMERGIPAHPVRVEVGGIWVAGSSTCSQSRPPGRRDLRK